MTSGSGCRPHGYRHDCGFHLLFVCFPSPRQRIHTSFFHIICVPTKSSYVRSPWVPGKSLASHCWVRHTKCTWSSFASCFSLNYDEILHFSISELLFILCESFHEDLLEHPCPSCICARQCHHLYLLS